MSGIVTFQGNPLTLLGRTINAGDAAPDFKAVTTGFKETRLADFAGKIKVITTFPSSDTPVCDLQLKEFNKRAASFSPDTIVIGISKDLPFAQKRFCELNGIEKVVVLSDYKYTSFGLNYGLLLKELNLLARSVLIVDKADVLRYIQIVPELTLPPDFDAALKALGKIATQPQENPKGGLAARCVPCQAGAMPLAQERVRELMVSLRGWELVDGKKIAKEFRFKDFSEAKEMLDLVALAAEDQGHHPSVVLSYGKLKVTLSTHAAGGLTENDFIMAGLIDGLGGGG